MAETETEVIGAGSQLMSSIKGVLIGLVMIPASFGVVWMASHRAQASEELQGAFPVAQKAKAVKEQKAVYATGKIKANQIGDPGYIKPGNYLSLSRTPEVYAYIETKETKTRKEGTKEIKETTYDCKLGWTDNPSGDYGTKGCRGKPRYSLQGSKSSSTANISLEESGKTYRVKGATQYGFDSLSLSESDLVQSNLTVSSNDVYFNKRCASSPDAGCQRYSYSGTVYDPASDHTVVGSETGDQFQKFNDFLIIGVGDYTNTMETVASSDSMWTLIWFGLSVVLFGGGLSLLVGPLLQIIEFIPFIGNFGAGVIRFILFAFAFVVMGLTFLLLEYWYL
ncbi:MAG: hypothetical protein KDK39_14020, partial [Leptospiraceae bacterium]|nr:hypothetical protein [Leptospiraceae bacterium]